MLEKSPSIEIQSIPYTKNGHLQFKNNKLSHIQVLLPYKLTFFKCSVMAEDGTQYQNLRLLPLPGIRLTCSTRGGLCLRLYSRYSSSFFWTATRELPD